MFVSLKKKLLSAYESLVNRCFYLMYFHHTQIILNINILNPALHLLSVTILIIYSKFVLF